MAHNQQTTEEIKEKESTKLGKFWLYDSKEDEFFMELSSTEVASKLDITLSHVYALVNSNGYYQSRWIVFDGTYGTPARFLAHFALPPRIIIEAKIPLSKMWGNKIYSAYYKKYRSHRQVIRLNEYGKEIKAYKTVRECAEDLGLTLSRVQSMIKNAKTTKRKIPYICFREDYATVYDKFYKGKWEEASSFGSARLTPTPNLIQTSSNR